MKLSTYGEARQWLKEGDKPRRMKANPMDAHIPDWYHSKEHDWTPECDNDPKCLPVDATVETHDGVTTDGHGQLLGRQGSEPRRMKANLKLGVTCDHYEWHDENPNCKDYGCLPVDAPPRRMKANPHTKWGAKHRVEHEENCRCSEYPECLPVDAPVEPRNESTTMNPKLPTYETAALMLMRWLINGTYRGIVHRHTGRIRAVDNSEGMIAEADTVTELAATEFRPFGEGCGIERKSFRLVDVVPPEPTPPPASAPGTRNESTTMKTNQFTRKGHDGKVWPDTFDGQVWAQEFIDMVKKNPVIATDLGAMIGWFANAIMRGWDEAHHRMEKPTPPHASAPEGTPVERWSPYFAKRFAGQDNIRVEVEEVERLCALLDEKERKGQEAQRYWMEIVAETQKDAQEQRTRAEKLQERLDGYLAKHGAPPLTVRTHGYMLMEKERDQLRRDLAAAQEARDNNQNEVIRLLSCLEDEREREAKLREALTGLLVFHPDDEFGAELPKEYWMPAYRSAVEKAAAALAAKEAR